MKVDKINTFQIGNKKISNAKKGAIAGALIPLAADSFGAATLSSTKSTINSIKNNSSIKECAKSAIQAAKIDFLGCHKVCIGLIKSKNIILIGIGVTTLGTLGLCAASMALIGYTMGKIADVVSSKD